MDPRLHALAAIPGLIVFVVVAVVATLLSVPVWLAVIIGVIVGAGVATALFLTAPDRVVGALHVRPLAEGENPRLDNLLDAMCVTHGYDRPEILIVESAATNSAVMVAPSGATLVLTQGLLDGVDRMSMEALLAHQLPATRRPEVAQRTRVAGLSSWYPAGLATSIAERLVAEPEPFLDDIEGAQLTRYPPGQVRLLEILAAGDNRVGGVSVVSAPLWLAEPLGRTTDETSRAAIDDRIALLREI